MMLLLLHVFFAAVRSSSGIRRVYERDFHRRLQKHGFGLNVPISYVSIPVATDDGPDIVRWPVLDPYDFAFLLQVNEQI